MQHKMQQHFNYRSMQQQLKAIGITFCRKNFSKSPLHICADSESTNPTRLDLLKSAVRKIYNSEVLTISLCNNLCDKNETFKLEA